MKLQEVRENICFNVDKENPEIKEDCYCDNCFYGRTFLALEIMKLKGIELNYLIRHTTGY